MRVVRRLVGAIGAVTLLTMPVLAGDLVVPGRAWADGAAPHHVTVSRHHPDMRVPIVVRRSGEAVADLRVSAPGTDWAVAGAESAVVSVDVDGRYASDLVVSGGRPLDRQLALGHLTAGVHMVRLRFADDRSPAGSAVVVVDALRVTTYPRTDPRYRVLRYAPVVIGRGLAELGGPYQNAVTDTPLLAWHEVTPAATAGHTVLTYSVVWSNEDGGTNTPALMARWGRTTDIEWVYSVELDERGERVPGSDTYQAPDHQTLPFAGRYDGDHAVLRTCTANNTMCDAVDGAAGEPAGGLMRFFLPALQTRPGDQAREYLMDTNPWTYQIMAKEMIREGRIEPPSATTALTFEVSDQRNYLYVVVKKTTGGANTGPSWIGVAVGVRLTTGETVHLSDHGVPAGSVQRDDPAATAVELPAGTTAADIAEVSVHREVVGADTGAPVHVTAMKRGFLLDRRYLPQPSFLAWSGEVVLDAAMPSAVLWRR